MNYPELRADIVEIFGESQAHGLDSGFRIIDLARQTENTKIWKALHPKRVHDANLRYRRAHGIGPKLRGHDHPRSKPFIDQIGKLYASLAEAAKLTGCTKGMISKVLRGKAAQARGFSFQYVEVFRPASTEATCASETKRT